MISQNQSRPSAEPIGVIDYTGCEHRGWLVDSDRSQCISDSFINNYFGLLITSEPISKVPAACRWWSRWWLVAWQGSSCLQLWMIWNQASYTGSAASWPRLTPYTHGAPTLPAFITVSLSLHTFPNTDQSLPVCCCNTTRPGFYFIFDEYSWEGWWR